MTNRETGEAYDLRTGQPWGAPPLADPADSSAGQPDLFRLRGLIPTRELLLATAGRQDVDDDDAAADTSSSGGGSGGSGSSSGSSSGAGGGSSGGAAAGGKKSKGSLFARAAHKVHKRSVAAAAKLSSGDAASGGGGSGGVSGSGLPMQPVLAGHEHTGDHVKVNDVSTFT
jgi:hypothetical protein